MHEIRIYGEIVPFQEKWITDQGGYVNLTTVQDQLNEAKGQDIKVRLNSMGGDAEEGFSIYYALRRYAKENDAKIEILGESYVASIATVIFLAGDTRILTQGTEPFVHNAWCYEMGDAKTMKRTSVDLEKCNRRIAEHYAAHTELTLDEALELMDNETSITNEEAKAMRFCTAIEEVLRPVALKRFNTQLNNDMNNNPKTKGALAKFQAFLKTFTAIVNKIVMTADEQELDFYELAEDDLIEVGAKAYYDGADAEGSYVMKSGETYVFVAGELTEIIAVAAEEVSEEVVAAMQTEIDSLTEALEQATNKAIELEAANKKQADTIANYKKITSKAPPSGEGSKPPKNENKDKESKASKAVAGYIQHQKK